MSTVVLEKFIKQARSILTADEQKELSRRLNEPEPEPKQRIKKNARKGSVSPNTIWMRDHSHKYPGMYVAVKDGEFVAAGRTIRDADMAAKEKGVEHPLLAYVPREDEELWGGW